MGKKIDKIKRAAAKMTRRGRKSTQESDPIQVRPDPTPPNFSRQPQPIPRPELSTTPNHSGNRETTELLSVQRHLESQRQLMAEQENAMRLQVEAKEVVSLDLDRKRDELQQRETRLKALEQRLHQQQVARQPNPQQMESLGFVRAEIAHLRKQVDTIAQTLVDGTEIALQELSRYDLARKELDDDQWQREEEIFQWGKQILFNLRTNGTSKETCLNVDHWLRDNQGYRQINTEWKQLFFELESALQDFCWYNSTNYMADVFRIGKRIKRRRRKS